MKPGTYLLWLPAIWLCVGVRAMAAQPIVPDPTIASALPAKLAFVPLAGEQYQFNTGALRGVMRQGGKGHGPVPVFDVATGRSLSRSVGWLSPYRLLATDARFGKAIWEWASTSKLLPDGALKVHWTADDAHPMDLTAVYRWAAPDTLDLTTTVTPKRDLQRFELFIGSYFDNFANAFVYARESVKAKASFLAANAADGHWQMFPRDDAAAQMIKDGRWKYPPNPVEWAIRPRMALPLGLRRDAEGGFTALVMAPKEDCFAVGTPYSGEKHFSLYLCTIGRDVKAGERTTVRARLVVGQNITDSKAVELYQAFVRSLVKSKRPAKQRPTDRR
ncbi:MAG: hypothetical protein N2689_06795 [Verrucomicrobiae bacterium]|nr:hypothetical protein [Verrucomicrobiae bacterium]